MTDDAALWAKKHADAAKEAGGGEDAEKAADKREDAAAVAAGESPELQTTTAPEAEDKPTRPAAKKK